MAGGIVRFGPFEADVATGELRRDGQRVRLQRQPFRLLEVLLQHHGELVTRDELRHALWPEGTYVAFERGLTSAVRKVREALGERADSPVYIETLAGRGYRFIAPVHWSFRLEERFRPEAEGTGSLNEPHRSFPLQPEARRKSPRLRFASAALVALTVLAGGQGTAPIRADERLAAAETLSAYACLLKSQGKFGEGLAVIQRAHALAPESARITAEVGFHLHAAGFYDAEFPMLRRALATDGKSPDAWFHLGLAQARRQKFDEAVAALERARTLASERLRAGAAHSVRPGIQKDVEYWLTWAREQRGASPGD